PPCPVSLHLFKVPTTTPRIFINHQIMSLILRENRLLGVPGEASL
uniref:Uncharacterized protein n=1 Tax=Macaca fascicularis TaxID=9541 RepID=A0A7N9CA07_MACFA